METRIGDQIVVTAYKAANEYLTANSLKADAEALRLCIKSWCKIKLPEAIADAKSAFECGMDQIGTQTFLASFALAGIEAAKEAGQPA